MLASVAMAKEKKPAAARAALDTVFATAHTQMADLKKHDVFGADNLNKMLKPNAILQTPWGLEYQNFTRTVGQSLASMLPDHLGPFPINHTYVQNFNLGAVLAANGISYNPCYFSSTPVGAFVGSTGMLFAPSIVNNFDVGMSAVSEALTIFPSLITVGPSDTQIEAIGALIAPTLISITPVREVHLRTGLSATPVDIAVVLAPPNVNGTEGEKRSAHGHVWEDENSWMERGGPAFLRHLQREHRDYKRAMAWSHQLQHQLRQEIFARLPDELDTLPRRLGGYEYWTRQTHEQPQPCYLRRRVAKCGAPVPHIAGKEAAAEEEVVLDCNEVALRLGSDSVGHVRLSPAQRRVAFTLLRDDGERGTAHVVDIGSGEEVDRIDGVASIEWATEDALLFTVPHPLGRPYQAWVRQLGQGGRGRLLLEEAEPERFLELGRSKDGQIVTLNASTKTSSEVHLVDASRPDCAPRLVQRRAPGLQYFLEHHAGQLLVLTNASTLGREYALMTCPLELCERRHWRPLVPERAGVAIEDIDVFAGYVLLHERHSGLPALSILRLPPPAFPHLGAPCPEGHAELRTLRIRAKAGAIALAPAANLDFDASSARVTACSPLRPDVQLDVDLATGCVTEVADGERPGPGPSPALLAVYGAYGLPLDVAYRPEYASLLERGWTLAWAHVRGGCELGRAWHAAATRGAKVLSVTDLETCADWLVAAGLAAPGRVALVAESAGGLAAGAALVRRPGRYGAAVLQAPLVDALTTMLDSGLPLTAHERDELGDPAAEPAEFAALAALHWKLSAPGQQHRTSCSKAAAMGSTSAYQLFTSGTPNGWKASVTLEELGVPYEVRPISLSMGEQKEPWFVKINPNARVPAGVGRRRVRVQVPAMMDGDVRVFESGAIMLYLAQKHPEAGLYSQDPAEQAEILSWLMFQMGGLGPMQGQASHFGRFAPERVEYAINRYTNETKRLYKVLDTALEGREYLAGPGLGKVSIADIANFCWVFCHSVAGIPLDDMPSLQAWLARIEARPAVQRGLDVPEPNGVRAMADPAKAAAIVEEVRRMSVSAKAEEPEG
ncbi:hypothetical protein WJX81_007901 [Elliptochloris bilobata]|uniref:Prolyl endopeptidase-like n=1 Tax=Elliptochloris bilobata TaxID=381761 RepID=A0AAW1SKE4_9CHLO